jgi:hypothetical protein
MGPELDPIHPRIDSDPQLAACQKRVADHSGIWTTMPSGPGEVVSVEVNRWPRGRCILEEAEPEEESHSQRGRYIQVEEGLEEATRLRLAWPVQVAAELVGASH